jgi:hypothetical protein
MSRTRGWSDAQLTEIVGRSFSWRQVLQALSLHPTGGNYKHVRLHAERLRLTTSHFLGQAHLRGRTHTWRRPIPLEQVLTSGSAYTSGRYLKKRLIQAGLLAVACSGWNRRMARPTARARSGSRQRQQS